MKLAPTWTKPQGRRVQLAPGRTRHHAPQLTLPPSQGRPDASRIRLPPRRLSLAAAWLRLEREPPGAAAFARIRPNLPVNQSRHIDKDGERHHQHRGRPADGLPETRYLGCLRECSLDEGEYQHPQVVRTHVQRDEQ